MNMGCPSIYFGLQLLPIMCCSFHYTSLNTLDTKLIYEYFNLLNVIVSEVAFLYSLSECVPL